MICNKLMVLGLAMGLALVCGPEAPAAGQDDVADVPSKDLSAGKDPQKRYFLIGPAKDVRTPNDGFGLVVILPGGDGSADFHPFVKRLFKNALPRGYLAAQPVALKWTDGQEIVWPTAKSKVEGMKFTTEEFIDAVIEDVARQHKTYRSRVFTLTWSSSGPAAYAASLTSKKVTGSFIAMSVFKPDQLPDLAAAKDRGYYLYHSPDDRVCAYRMAQQAEKDLKQAGASVKLVAYEGGHGWRGPVYDDVRDGIAWLEKHHGPAGKP
jgi:predicted esterase